MGQSLSSAKSSSTDFLPAIVVQSLSCVQSSTTAAQEIEENPRSDSMIITENEDQLAQCTSKTDVQLTSSVLMSENGDAEGSQRRIEPAECEETSVQREETFVGYAEETPEERSEEPQRESNEPSEASTAASAPSDKEKLIVENFLRKNKYPSVDGEKVKTSCNKTSADYPLHAAAKQNDEAVVKALLLAGADKTKLNHQKKTAAQLAKKKSPVAVLLAV